MTPDWAAKPTAVPYAMFGDPQSLNLYSFGRNDPVSRADADGHISSEAICSDPHGCIGAIVQATNEQKQGAQGAQNHGFWWNVGHYFGFFRTNEDVAEERRWLQQNVDSIDGIPNKDFAKLTPNQVDNEYARANAGLEEGRYNVVGTPTGSGWTLGSGKSAQKWANQMAQRGWTPDQITEAIQNGQQFPATNNINPANGATRYVNPSTGRSVVVDNVTREVIHVGGDGFQY